MSNKTGSVNPARRPFGGESVNAVGRAGNDRRRILLAGASFAGMLAVPSLAAAIERLLSTPRQMEGPFYPLTLPLDDDADLLQVAGRSQQASGQVTHISGRITDPQGRPVRKARVEIWQCDAFGFYHHPRDRDGRADPNFQGFGHAVTNDQGAFHFRTIRPVPYPGRAPHIHFKIRGNDFADLTTQMYVAGEPLNQRDYILNSVGNADARQRLIVKLEAAEQVEAGALAGVFNIVLGVDALSR